MQRLLTAAAAAIILTVTLFAGGSPPIPAASDEPPKPAHIDDPYAEPPPKPLTWQEKAKRDAIFREGQKLISEEKWKDASEKLREALRVRSDPEILLWLSFAEAKMDKLVNAKRYCIQARAEATAAKLPDLVQRANEALADLNKSVPRIKLKVPPGTTTMVYVDEAVVKYPDDGIEVDPGTHTLLVTAPERKDFRTQVIIRAGEVQLIEVLLPSVAPPAIAVTAERPPPGCGCRTANGVSEREAGALVLGGLALLMRRRRRR